MKCPQGTLTCSDIFLEDRKGLGHVLTNSINKEIEIEDTSVGIIQSEKQEKN
jgi:hypothetical protein